MRYNINGEFPMMANWLTVRKTEHGTYYITNVLLNESYEFDERTYRFLKSLNGDIDPRRLVRKYEIDISFMDFLEEKLLIRTEGRKLLSDNGTYMRTMYIPKKKTSRSMILKLGNMLLLVGWCPILIWGIYRFLHNPFEFNLDFWLWGYILSFVLGLVMHEAGHVIACMAYEGRFCEVGIMWKYVYPGAYVLMDTGNIKSKLKRVQVDAAGIEVNLLLTGIFLLLASSIECLSGCFFLAALNNLLLGVMNCTFIDGLDGFSILGELIGLREGTAGAKLVVKNNFEKTRWRERSVNKKAVVVTCAILLFYQILLPLLITNNLLILIGGCL